jgi:hypothetical protein
VLHPDDMQALARQRQEDALAWAARRRLIGLAATGAGHGAARPSPAAAESAADLRRSIEHLGRLTRGVVLVTVLIVAAAALSGLLTLA